MNIQCHFDTGSAYRCVVFDKEIPENGEFNLIGTHYNGRTHDEVKEILFNNCQITKIPQGLTKTFPNLNIINIYHSNLKNLVKADLEEYKNIKKFTVFDDLIDIVPGDLFENCKKLEKIVMNFKSLTVVEPDILDRLDKLKYVDMSEYGFYDSATSNPSASTNLDQIKTNLFDRFFKHDEVFIKNFVRRLQRKVHYQPRFIPVPRPGQTVEEHIKLQNEFYSDIKAFTLDDTTKDFQIQIDKHDFPVHKFLLAARSPTLAELLKNNPEVENLNLVDISVEIFEIILKFLYTDELPGDDETNFLHLFAAAGKLKIKKLMNFAANKLNDMIDEENVLEIFKIACKYEQQELKQKAFGLIKEKYPKSKFKDEWIDDAEKVEKLIEFLKKMEEMEKSFEDMM
ncbi:unnamed protein product [Chironomus riparius]|uniref:BTB domain-containing protein n=1 Tax=Chironomus riparius TaxID=315576 RepID=A0A9N9S634_9DIPT|nr:unnamed protein product [Chironomus riparius]